MVTPPSALARNASGSNLDFDFFATANPSAQTSRVDYRKPGGPPSRSTMFGTEPRRLLARLAVRSNRRRQSNDHCEQFDQSDSNHQHRDRYRIVIEPMPLLYIRDTPPWCSNLRTCAHMCRTVSLWGLCYSCVSSCSTSAAMCRGTGGARASYWALRQSPSDSQTLLSRAKTGRFRGDRFT
jgi:hypothetical protein